MTNNNLRKMLKRKAFMVWLQSKQPRTVVGSPALSCSCPVARFLSLTGSFSAAWEVVVGLDTIALFEEVRHEQVKRAEISTPKWASRFIERLDDLYGNQRFISAGKALAVLGGQA